ncbi:hypothetical protein ACI7RC_08525 [Brevibacillus sp. B_LB10_24]|uniref:hypothetical protein n=1 Tax=Brevibacillus sp. B_LB10_24 TaxID=3380645 RepID=UPI0038BADAC7
MTKKEARQYIFVTPIEKVLFFLNLKPTKSIGIIVLVGNINFMPLFERGAGEI